MRITLVVSLLFAVSPLLASKESKDQAQIDFDEGIELFHSGRYAEAADAFRRANKLNPNWKLLYNIGQSEAAAKRYGLALEAFEVYLSQGGDDIPEKRREEVLGEVERLRKMVGAVNIKAPDGSIVFVNGIERDRAPLPGSIMIAASVVHQIAIKLNDKTLYSRSIRLYSGQTVNIEADAATKAEIPKSTQQSDEKAALVEVQPIEKQSESKSEEETRSSLGIWGWVTSGIGGALLAGGAVTGGVALSTNNKLQENCPNGECPSDYWEYNDRLSALAITTDVLLGGGAVLTISGVVMVIMSYSSQKEDRNELIILPSAGPNFAGAMIQGRF
ncbi:MAG: tetratricopeptide repeat protein [Proteobacteria bacterium]|nr:tetratricopeptide repeat protein [Pseudomonadota bacterium]